MSSCQQDSVSPIKIYGISWDGETNKKEVVICVNDYISFDSLYAKVEEIACEQNLPVLEIPSKEGKKHIRLVNPCWENIGCFLIRACNVFSIKDEYIYFDRKYDLHYLDFFLDLHYTNYGEFAYFSKHPNRVIISISYDEKDISNIVALLDKVTDSFDKLNLDIPLVIALKKEVPPPPKWNDGKLASSTFNYN